MIDVRLLGQVAVTVDDAPLSGEAAQRRRIALLALLCLPPPRPISRDRLMLYLWPENGSESARHLLSVALHALRSSIGKDALVSGRDDVAVEPSCFHVDVADFEAALARGEDEAAVALYGGPLMDGFHAGPLPEFEQWLDGERARLQGRYAQALEAVAQSRSAADDNARAVEAWQRLAALDSLSTHYALGLMRALAAAGNRAGALRHAAVHRQLLESELGTGPDPDVEALAEELRREPAAPPPRPRPVAGVSTDAAATPSPVSTAAATTPAPPASPAQATSPGSVAGLPSAPVVAGDGAERAPDPVRPGGPRAGWRSSLWPAAALGAAAVIVIAAAALTLMSVWDRLQLPLVLGDAPGAVALLPFRGETAEPAAQAVEARVTDGMTERLDSAHVPLVPQTSSSAARARHYDAAQIGRELKAAWVLDARLTLSGDSIHLTVELASARNNLHLRNLSYDALRTDAGELGKRVADDVISSVFPPRRGAAVRRRLDQTAHTAAPQKRS